MIDNIIKNPFNIILLTGIIQITILSYGYTKPYQSLLSIIILSILAIMYGHKNRSIQLGLQKKIYTFPAIIMDYWSISHFMTFAIVGFFYPNKIIEFLILGIMWECLEDYLAANSNTQLVNCIKYKKSFWCNGIQDDYWYGKWDDIIFNFLGYLLGNYIKNKIQ